MTFLFSLCDCSYLDLRHLKTGFFFRDFMTFSVHVMAIILMVGRSWAFLNKPLLPVLFSCPSGHL